jgi:uncharacterized damage-inducible protein DinB
MLDQIIRLLTYDTWANERMLDSVRTSPNRNPRLDALAAHIFSSKRMWLGRIKGSADATINTWPGISYEETVALDQRMRADWGTYIGGLAEDDLQTIVHYEIKDVGPGQQTVADIIMHKFLHAAYHRGQVAQLVRECGGTPASTDMVVWAKVLRETGAA